MIGKLREEPSEEPESPWLWDLLSPQRSTTNDGGTMRHPDWTRTPQAEHRTDWHRRDWGPPSMPADRRPRYTVSYRKMGVLAGTFHACMMVLTMGLWTPMYLAARRGRKTVTRVG